MSFAQTDNSIGNWNGIIIKGKMSQRLSLMTESHIRTGHYNLKYDYFEIKSGISYSITKNIHGLIGAGFYNTYQTGALFQTPARQKEFRTWFELNYFHSYNRFNFEQRVRIEQRFIPDNYKNRLKYRLLLQIPINKKELIKGSIYFLVNDELFMTQYGLWVEKIRFYSGVGYKLNSNTNWQIGCVSDTDYKSNSHSIQNYLQILLIYDFANFIKKHT